MESTTQAQPSINQRFDTLATSDLSEFRQFFRRLHKLFPQQAAEACLLYIASHGLDSPAKSMAYWLAGDATYVNVLLDISILPPDAAAKAIAVVKDVDPQFLIRFLKAASTLTAPTAILRALGFLPSVGDYSIFIPWLRTLNHSADARIHSRAGKLLCELRPSKGMIEKQMQSADGRVRASAIEALWNVRNEDARALFHAALSDTHHRVVTNAMVGLYRLGETQILDKLIELSTHKQQLFRAATAWALGVVNDLNAIPALQQMTRDPSLTVRKRALNSLLALESLKTPDMETELDPADQAPAPQQDPLPLIEAVPEAPPASPPDLRVRDIFTYR